MATDQEAPQQQEVQVGHVGDITIETIPRHDETYIYHARRDLETSEGKDTITAMLFIERIDTYRWYATFDRGRSSGGLTVSGDLDDAIRRVAAKAFGTPPIWRTGPIFASGGSVQRTRPVYGPEG